MESNIKTIINIKVVPGASRSEIVGWLGESLKLRVVEPAEKGKANVAVKELVCERLKISADAARITAGLSSQRKVIEIHGLTKSEVISRISEE